MPDRPAALPHPSTMETLKQVINDEPVTVRMLAPKTPLDLETICHKCLLKDANRRYPTAEELAEDLRRFQAGEPILARPVGRVERAVKWALRNKVEALLYLVGAAFFAVLLIGTPTLWILNGQLQTTNRDLDKSNRELTIQTALAKAAEQDAKDKKALAEIATKAAVKAKEAEEKEKEAAQTAFHQAIESIEGLFQVAAGTTMRGDPGNLPLRRDLLERVVSIAQKLDPPNQETIPAHPGRQTALDAWLPQEPSW